MKTKKIVLIMCIGFALCSFQKSNSEMQKNSRLVKKENKTNGAILYQKNYKKYTYYIETIGIVSIDNVELNDKKLTAIYSYEQSNEYRNVVSELHLDKDGIYKGTCTTKVNGKKLLAVNTWLTFSEDGTATGNWCWLGNPSKNDPIVKITNEN